MSFDVGTLRVGHLPRSEGRAWLVTPEWATWALKTFNSHNRKRIENVVARYKMEMETGNFQLTHQALSFSVEPIFLIDGQHRLYAVEESGVSVPMRIFTDQEPDNQLVVDDHKIRSVADSFTLSGLSVTSREVSVTRAFLIGPLAIRNDVTRGGAFTKTSLKEMMTLHLQAIRFAISMLGHGKQRGITASFLAVLARAYYHEDHEQIAAFAATVITGFPQGEDPVVRTPLALRKYLLESGAACNGSSGKLDVYRKTQRLLRAYLDGVVLEKATASDKDLFPLPKPDFVVLKKVVGA